MKITLFIEFGALTCGLGMLVGGFFGMNLHTGLEDSKWDYILIRGLYNFTNIPLINQLSNV